MSALLDEHHVRLATLADLLAGALRARLEAEEERPMARVRSNRVRCSFCGRDRDEASRLVAGPGVYICDRCIELCNEVLAQSGPRIDPPVPAARIRRRAPDLPRLFRTWLRNVFRISAPSAG
jgi:hypothetical protein